MNTKAYIEAFYDAYDEDGRRASRHGAVEFAVTMTYIERYAKPGMRILEIGAGTGRYSHTLARRGFCVDAVELAEHNIELFRRNTAADEPVTIRQGDARDLSAFADETYDVTLLLGPMYHLFTRGDQSAALAEAVRVTKRGGVVFAAYCMRDAAILQYGFVRGNVLRCIEQGMLDPESFETHSEPKDVFELYRREDIDLLRGALPVTQLHFVASDGFTNHIRETVDAMDDAVYAVWLRYCLATCERQDMVGCSHHTIDIFRKNT